MQNLVTLTTKLQSLLPVRLFRKKPEFLPKKRLLSAWSVILVIGVVGSIDFLCYRIVSNLILSSLKSNALLQVQVAANDIDEWLSNRLTEIKLMSCRLLYVSSLEYSALQ